MKISSSCSGMIHDSSKLVDYFLQFSFVLILLNISIIQAQLLFIRFSSIFEPRAEYLFGDNMANPENALICLIQFVHH